MGVWYLDIVILGVVAGSGVGVPITSTCSHGENSLGAGPRFRKCSPSQRVRVCARLRDLMTILSWQFRLVVVKKRVGTSPSYKTALATVKHLTGQDPIRGSEAAAVWLPVHENPTFHSADYLKSARMRRNYRSGAAVRLGGA